jgi:hypothetical protein
MDQFPQLYEAFKQAMRLHCYKDGNQQQKLADKIGKTAQYFSYLLNHSTDTSLSTFFEACKGMGKDMTVLLAFLLKDETPEDVEAILKIIARMKLQKRKKTKGKKKKKPVGRKKG